ncbi:uncharacterized protein LOC103882937 [Papio anubis]|uniref:uncharacterized protein LOC103882937 n=1 Tax=Papio anubis TaxID=9555 RepID=UPI0012ADFBE1|nr:uncharacterized protein LOC103882937 [Papio anubis]
MLTSPLSMLDTTESTVPFSVLNCPNVLRLPELFHQTHCYLNRKKTSYISSSNEVADEARQTGWGAQLDLNLLRPASPRSSCARKCEPARSFRFSPAAPQAREHPRPHTKGTTALPPLRCQMSRAEVLTEVLANQTSVTPDACPHSKRAGGTATGRLCPSQGAERGQGARHGAAAAPDGLKLTGGHRRAGQAGVAGRCHLRAPLASLLAQPRCGRRSRCPRPAARSLRGPQPMAKSWGRAESTSLRTLPALPAPPDDALPPPLFICGFRPAPRLCTLFSGCQGVGGSRGRPRGGRDGRISAPRRAPLPAALPCARLGPGRPGGPEPPRQLPHPLLGSRLSGRTSSSPGRGGGRRTDRATSPSPSAPTPLAHTQRKERRRGRTGAGSATAGLTAPASGAGWGGCELLDTGRRDGGPGSRGAGEAGAGREASAAAARSAAPRV